MPKYIIPFANPSKKIETKLNCNFCESIDKVYNEVQNETNELIKQEKLASIEANLLVDGYNLLSVYEKNSYTSNDINKLKLYKSNTSVFMSKVLHLLKNETYTNDPTIDDPILIHSRWCKDCGSRKLDIYDTERQDNIKITNISNFNVDYKLKPSIKVSWEDDHNAWMISQWGNTKLIKRANDWPTISEEGIVSGDVVTTYSSLIDMYEINSYIERNCDLNQTYFYRAFMFDKSNKILTSKDVININYNKIANITWVDSYNEVIIENWSETRLIRKEGSIPEKDHDGTIILHYSDEINKYAQTSFFDDEVNNNKDYYYRAALYDKFNNLINLIDVNVEFENIAYIKWEDIDKSIFKNWYKTKLIRKINSPPTNIYDGNLIVEYLGDINKYRDIPFEDININKDINYYYRAFLCDIYDNNIRSIDVSKEQILNDKIIAYIKWEDPSTAAWEKTSLWKKTGPKEKFNILEDWIEIESYTDINKYKNIEFIDDTLKEGNVYYYRIIAYDALNNEIKRSKDIEIYIPTNDFIAPAVITDTKIVQYRKLVDNLGEINYVDELKINWTDPTDEDYDATKLIMNTEFIPGDENDGVEIDHNDSFKIFNIDMTNNLPFNNNGIYNFHVGDEVYFKPISYDKLKTKKSDNGLEYLNYRNYANDSKGVGIKIQPHIGNVSNISAVGDLAKILIKWTDPIDENWIGTKVLYKVTDSYIMDENDGIEIIRTTIRNQHQNTALEIENLTSESQHCIAMFPLSKNDNGNEDYLCNVQKENQTYATPFFIIPPPPPPPPILDINFKDSSYLSIFKHLGTWEIAGTTENKFLKTVGSNTGDSSVCYIELNDQEKTILTFDYLLFGKQDPCSFDLYVNYEKIFTVDSFDMNWRSYKHKIPANNYVNIAFRFNKNNFNDFSYVCIDNIKLIKNLE